MKLLCRPALHGALGDKLPPIRLSQKNAQLIVIGLKFLLMNNDFCRQGFGPFCRPDLPFRSGLQSKGKFQQRYINLLSDLRGHIERIKQRGGRAYIDCPFATAAIMLAVRAARQCLRDQSNREVHAKVSARAARLLHRLEKHRKRAKRAFVAIKGSTLYAAESAAWRSFIVWARLHLLHFGPTVLIPGRYNKALLNTFEKWTRAELTAQSLVCPPPRQLRALIRVFVRYVRRGRREYGLATLMRNRSLAAKEFAAFVILKVRTTN